MCGRVLWGLCAAEVSVRPSVGLYPIRVKHVIHSPRVSVSGKNERSLQPQVSSAHAT